MMKTFDIIVIGAGPAGMAAAHAAASAAGRRARVAMVDDNPHAGGQIWRGGPQNFNDARAAELWSALSANPSIEYFPRTKICGAPGDNTLLAESAGAPVGFRYEKLVLATGARERLLPFPGWTLPGVTGAGGLQALSKGGYPVAGKRIVVAGTGPLLLAVAATLKAKGAHVVAIVEQASLPRLARFAMSLALTPEKLMQALRLRKDLAGVAYMSNSHVVAARGSGSVEEVEVMQGGRKKTFACDYLACGYGLIPNAELATALGCATANGAVHVDELQTTSVHDIYCAGEGTGIGGVDLSLAEGRIAGFAAIGRPEEAARHFDERARWRAFAARLERTFALRPELRGLCGVDTIVCRCEDVTHGDLEAHTSWRSAKLHTRCGMGPCQGRVCGAATGFLYGWTQDSIRLPLSPMRISGLIAEDACDADALSAASAPHDTRSA